MNTRRFAPLVALSLLCVFSARADEAASKADVQRLQGEWTMVSGSADGQAVPEGMLEQSKRVCKDDVTTVTIGEQLILKAKFTLDPSKDPKHIDYEVIDGPTKGKKHHGIYAFDGETVKFCFGAPDAERPADFTSNAGQRRTLSVWKRVKKE